MSSSGARLRGPEAVWLAAGILAPLVFNPAGCNAFELPKSLVVQALALTAILSVLLASSRGEPGVRGAARRSSPLLFSIAALGATILLSTVFSSNVLLSLWGSHARQQGMLTLVAYLTLAAVVATQLRTWAEALRLMRAIVWGSVPVVVYGLIQAFGFDPLPWRTDAASPVLSTIGRANFLGSYLVLVGPLTLALARLSPRRWAYLLLLAGQLLVLVLTEGRSAWIGLGVAGLAFALLWAAVAQRPRLALAGVISAVAIVVALGLLNRAAPSGWLASLPRIDRLATLGDTSSGSTAARLTMWRAALPLAASRLWLGYGPETTELAFAAVYPPQLVYYQGRDAAVDRVHNLWLDQALSSGVLGVLALASVLVVFGWLVVRVLRGPSGHQVKLIAVALASAAAGHVTDLQFSFDLTTTATIFWLIVGLGAALGRGLASDPEDVKATQRRSEGWISRSQAWGLAAWGTGILAVGVLCMRPLLADIACFRAGNTRLPVAERLEAAASATRLWPVQVEYHRRLAAVQGQAGQTAAAEASLQVAIRMTPADPDLRASLGDLYAQWGETEPERIDQAAAQYRQAIRMSPNVATYHVALGAVLARQGQGAAAIEALERATALDATNGVAFAYLSTLYRSAERTADADAAEQEAITWGAGDLLGATP